MATFAACTAAFVGFLVIGGSPGDRIVTVVAALAAATGAVVSSILWRRRWPQP